MSALTTLPDATSIKTRFPEFETVADASIVFAIAEAARDVDQSWAEGDQIAAVSLLTAHYLAVAGASAGVDGRAVVSETIGPISVTYAQVAAAAAAGKATSQLETTSYGKRYQSLLRKNRGGPITIGGTMGPWPFATPWGSNIA